MKKNPWKIIIGMLIACTVFLNLKVFSEKNHQNEAIVQLETFQQAFNKEGIAVKEMEVRMVNNSQVADRNEAMEKISLFFDDAINLTSTKETIDTQTWELNEKKTSKLLGKKVIYSKRTKQLFLSVTVRETSVQSDSLQKIEFLIENSNIRKLGPNTQTFTCVRGVSNDKISKGLYAYGRSIISNVDAHLNSQYEEGTFAFFSAYNKAWNQKINDKGRAMNIQLGIRQLSLTDVQFVIGSPLITSEF